MKVKRLSIRTKLLIYEYKERFPQLSPEEISMIFCINEDSVKKVFDEEHLIVSSKMNK